MADTIFGSGAGHWVCPNDRQLALRAKLQTGWSVHTFQTEKQRKTQALSPQEHEVILEVIRKAEKLDITEQQRIGRLVERLENMRKNAMGNGLSQCLLCGELLGLLGSTSVFCQDCKKKVCTKCGIETIGNQKRPLWLCKICSEQREVWKRSGAWFYKGLPKYIAPSKSSCGSEQPARASEAAGPAGGGSSRAVTWARGKVVSSDSESDSELSSCSLDEKPAGGRARGSRDAAQRAGAAPAAGAPGRVPGDARSPVLSGSRSSLASEARAALSATESDQAAEGSGARAPGTRRSRSGPRR